MGFRKTVILRGLRGHAVWLAMAPVIGVSIVFASAAMPVGAATAEQPHPGPVVASVMAGADIVLASAVGDASGPSRTVTDRLFIEVGSATFAACAALVVAAVLAVSHEARRVRTMPASVLRSYLGSGP